MLDSRSSLHYTYFDEKFNYGMKLGYTDKTEYIVAIEKLLAQVREYSKAEEGST